MGAGNSTKGMSKKLRNKNHLYDKAVTAYSKRQYNRKAPCAGGPGESRLLMIRLDYKRTNKLDPRWHALDTSFAEVAFLEFAQKCGITDITEITDTDDGKIMATKDNVLEAIEDIGGRCENDDCFIIYYTGHGAQVADENEDEDDGSDEAWCLIDDKANCTPNTWLIDDELAEAISTALPPKGRFLMLSDSCHSGSMCDFNSGDQWDTHRDCLAACDRQHFHAVSISGCDDSQESQGTGQGGVFSNSMFLTADRLNKKGKKDYSVADFYNKMLLIQGKLSFLASKQSMQIAFPEGSDAGMMPWPLAPIGDYDAPMSKAANDVWGNHPESYGVPPCFHNSLKVAHALVVDDDADEDEPDHPEL